jgi:hypothetical protein
MRMLSREELAMLMQGSENPAVSMYMPTHRVGDLEQDPIRLKNLLREAERMLADHGLGTTDTRDLLRPIEQLLADSHFWQHQGDGLAIFSSARVFQYYQLPHVFGELVFVADRFHVKPLIPLFSQDGLFYVLAVSQNQVRLLQCTRYHVREVTPEDVPSSLADALKHDDPESQHQFHTTGPGGMTISHGHGIGKEHDKVNVLRYFQQVDRGLQPVLKDEHAPLIIAAVDYLHPIYREANKYRYLLEEGIEGNPDDISENTLQEKAWPIVKPYFERGLAEALERYAGALAKGLATNDVKEAALAAHDGRVSTLFVPADTVQWGQFDPKTRKIRLYSHRGPGIEDLLDFTAVHTLTRGGIVYAADPKKVPGEASIGAIFRY